MKPIRLLLVHPGASISVHDVFVGLRAGLKGRGHHVYEYSLNGRIEAASRELTNTYQRRKRELEKAGETEKAARLHKPNQADMIYMASEPIVAKALRVQPDVVLIVSGMYLHPDAIVLLRRAGIPAALLLTESPYDDPQQMRIVPYFDVVWTNERTSVSTLAAATRFSKRPVPVKYLRHAWTPEIHSASYENYDVASHDVVFVGTGFQERKEWLEAVDWTGIDLGLYGSWDLVGPRSRLRPYIKGGYTPNDRATALYHRAKIGLNFYRTSKGFGKNAAKIDGAESLNPRAYELAAAGCFTISDYRAEVAEVFGDLVPTVSSPSDLRPLLDRWLRDDQARRFTQAKLPPSVAQHTWHARAAQVESDLVDTGIVALDGHQLAEVSA